MSRGLHMPQRLQGECGLHTIVRNVARNPSIGKRVNQRFQSSQAARAAACYSGTWFWNTVNGADCICHRRLGYK